MGSTDTSATDGAVKNVQSKSAAKSGLTGSVGFKGANAPDDVWKVSSALTNNGLMQAPQRHADNTLFTSITSAQENMDTNLKRDGLVNPGGPTESTYTKYVGQGVMKAPSNPVIPANAGTQETGAGDGGLADPTIPKPPTNKKPAEPETGGLYASGTAKDVLRRDHAKREAAEKQTRIQRQEDRRREKQQAEAQKRTQQSMARAQVPASNPIEPETVKKAVEGLGALANKAVLAFANSNRHPEQTAKKYGVDPDLARAIMYMETTHGYYDAPLDLFGVNKSIRPMNVNIDFWKNLGISRDDLNDPAKNIDAGVRILGEIAKRVPDGSIRKIATLYNNLGASSVSDYGARVEKIFQDKVWGE